MEDRILINGVWYVREALIENVIEQIETTDYLGCTYETENYSWEATRIFKDDQETFYDGFDIKFIDKLWKNYEPQYWDNMGWFESVYENNPDAIADAKEVMNEEGFLHFRAFLKELKKRGWF